MSPQPTDDKQRTAASATRLADSIEKTVVEKTEIVRIANHLVKELSRERLRDDERASRDGNNPQGGRNLSFLMGRPEHYGHRPQNDKLGHPCEFAPRKRGL